MKTEEDKAYDRWLEAVRGIEPQMPDAGAMEARVMKAVEGRRQRIPAGRKAAAWTLWAAAVLVAAMMLADMGGAMRPVPEQGGNVASRVVAADGCAAAGDRMERLRCYVETERSRRMEEEMRMEQMRNFVEDRL